MTVFSLRKKIFFIFMFFLTGFVLFSFDVKEIKTLQEKLRQANSGDISDVEGALPQILARMRQNGVFMWKLVGLAAHKPNQYILYEKMRDIATHKELESIVLNDESACVRIYASLALAEKKAKANYVKIARKAIDDGEIVATMYFDMIHHQTAGDMILTNIFQFLSEKQQEQIRLKAVQIQSPLVFTQQVLASDEKSEKLYEATRKWALQGSEWAILGLAKYKKSEDYDLILQLKDKNKKLFFEACPHILNDNLKPFFEEYMEKILTEPSFDAQTWRAFYIAVAAFHNDFSKNQLNLAFSDKANKSVQKYHLEYVFNAVRTYDDGFYDDIIKNLWENYNFADERLAERFLHEDKHEGIRLLLVALDNPDKVMLQNEFYTDYDGKTEFFDFAFQTLFDEKIDFKEIYARQLKTMDVNAFKVYFKYIEKFPDDDVTPALLERLEIESNGKNTGWGFSPNDYVLNPIYKYLTAKNDADLTEKLIKIYESHKEKWSSGTVEKLLKIKR